MLRSIIKRMLFPILEPWSKWYFSKPRPYQYHDLRVIINPGVFFPHLTISTKLLLDHVGQLDLKDKKILELGAGSGIVSLRCAQLGSEVTASDISNAAIHNITQNAKANDLALKIIRSDLFEGISDQFDLIIINPPYYPRDPKTEAEHAWFCGADLEYFRKLARQLPAHFNANGKAIMILSEDSPISRIRTVLENRGLRMLESHRWKRMMETNFLFEVT